MRRKLNLLLGAIVAVLIALPASASDAAKKPPTGKDIDVVICLDTSNSMDGLIASAKAKLWDIVNDLAKARPTPNLRVGLYSYGNNGYDAKAGWVRKELDLNTDLDAVSQKLFALTTHGGEEYVGRVCRDALDQQKWCTDKNALKLIFVCGNEPASQDKLVKLPVLADLAKGKGVIINPIYCGGLNDGDSHDWKNLATLAGGQFINIDQQAGTVAIATPYDKELIDLGTKLNTTYIAYGRMAREKVANQAAQDLNAERLSLQAGAARAATKGGELYKNSEWCLVDKCREDPKFDVKKVAVEDLPENMKKMTPEQREKHVKEMMGKREQIQKDIKECEAKRQKYIAEETKKKAGKAEKAFDEAVRAVLREQAETKGITIPK